MSQTKGNSVGDDLSDEVPSQGEVVPEEGCSLVETKGSGAAPTTESPSDGAGGDLGGVVVEGDEENTPPSSSNSQSQSEGGREEGSDEFGLILGAVHNNEAALEGAEFSDGESSGGSQPFSDSQSSTYSLNSNGYRPSLPSNSPDPLRDIGNALFVDEFTENNCFNLQWPQETFVSLSQIEDRSND